jgi:hypothetical protein
VAPKCDPDEYGFPDPTLLFMFAALAFLFAVVALFSSVSAGIGGLVIASLFALMGLLKKRRIIP